MYSNVGTFRTSQIRKICHMAVVKCSFDMFISSYFCKDISFNSARACNLKPATILILNFNINRKALNKNYTC